MTEVLFYHLERASLEQVLPDLLEKTVQRGWRATVRCGSCARVEALDLLLWTYRDDSFLPHGCDDPGRQPVFLSIDDASSSGGAEVLFLLDGAAPPPDSLKGLVRCVAIIDGADPASVAGARAFWKTVKAVGLEATYWKQSSDTGRWEKQGLESGSR